MIRLKSEESKLNKRKELAGLFVSKRKLRGEDVWNVISDVVYDNRNLGKEELKSVKSVINDLNELFQIDLGLRTVIRTKMIDKYNNKIGIFINPKYL